MFTLDGRVRFQLGLSEVDEARFRQEKIKEISLELLSGSYYLRFVFSKSLEQANAVQTRELDLPSYLVVHNTPVQSVVIGGQQDVNLSIKAA